MPFFDIYGGSGGAETILTSKYSGSSSSVSKGADSGPPGAEKLIFSDKTSSSLIDCSLEGGGGESQNFKVFKKTNSFLRLPLLKDLSEVIYIAF